MGGSKNKSCPNGLKNLILDKHIMLVKYLFFQLIRTTNKQVLFLKKIWGMLLFETLKIKKSDFLNSNTCFYSRLYGIRSCNNHTGEAILQELINAHDEIIAQGKKFSKKLMNTQDNLIAIAVHN